MFSVDIDPCFYAPPPGGYFVSRLRFVSLRLPPEAPCGSYPRGATCIRHAFGVQKLEERRNFVVAYETECNARRQWRVC